MKMKQIIMLMIFACVMLMTAHEAQAFYNPSAGRWLSRDPLSEKGASILSRVSQPAISRRALVADRRRLQSAGVTQRGNPDYAFCANAAVNVVDPLGLQPKTEAEAAGACSNPCAQYKNDELERNEGALFGGGVVCCGGKKYACTWSADEVANALARPVIQRCQAEHERDHFDDIDDNECPPCDWQPRRPGFKYGNYSRNRSEECSGHWRAFYCLVNSLGGCGGDPDCEAVVQEWIDAAMNGIRNNCDHDL